MQQLEEIESYFKRKIDLLGDLAEPSEVRMIYYLIDQAKKLDVENEKLSRLNRHYFFKFYGQGKFDQFVKDCAYLMDR